MPGRKLLIILLVSALVIQACGQAAQPTADKPILATGKNSTSTVEPFIASETPATFSSKNLQPGTWWVWTSIVFWMNFQNPALARTGMGHRDWPGRHVGGGQRPAQ